jgi:hypothetical protein
MGLGASNDPIGAQGAHASGGGRSAALGGGGHRATRAPQDPNWYHIAIHLV